MVWFKLNFQYYRLAASNGELTITPARGGGSPGRTPPCKLSPASTDASDLLADSPGIIN